MRVLFIFLDGIGLGENNPETNPFARARMPRLSRLLDVGTLLKECAPFHGEQASLVAVDPAVGVPGLPQSATGQAILLTVFIWFLFDQLLTIPWPPTLLGDMAPWLKGWVPTV